MKKKIDNKDLSLIVRQSLLTIKDLKETLELKDSLILKQNQLIEFLKSQHHKDVFENIEYKSQLKKLSSEMLELVLMAEKRNNNKLNNSKRKMLNPDALEIKTKIEALDLLLLNENRSERSILKEVYEKYYKEFIRFGIFEDFESFKQAFRNWIKREVNQITYPKISEYLTLKERK